MMAKKPNIRSQQLTKYGLFCEEHSCICIKMTGDSGALYLYSQALMKMPTSGYLCRIRTKGNVKKYLLAKALDSNRSAEQLKCV